MDWLFYDPDVRIQLRVRTRATVHHDDAVADARWLASSLSSRRCYLAPHPPGTELPGFDPNLPVEARSAVPSEAVLEAGRRNFAAIVAAIESLESLHLDSTGHRRARFVYEQGRPVSGVWLAA